MNVLLTELMTKTAGSVADIHPPRSDQAVACISWICTNNNDMYVISHLSAVTALHSLV